MKKVLMSLIAFVCISQCGYALLPPLYQTTAEITAILANDEIGKHLKSGEVITQINKTGNGYEIVTNKSRVMVDIIHQPSEMPGPGRFTLRFQEVQPL